MKGRRKCRKKPKFTYIIDCEPWLPPGRYTCTFIDGKVVKVDTGEVFQINLKVNSEVT